MGITVGSQSVKGAAPGTYRVRISLFVAPDGTPLDSSKPQEVPGREMVPDQYSSLDKTKLEATIPPAGGTKDFDLKSK